MKQFHVHTLGDVLAISLASVLSRRGVYLQVQTTTDSRAEAMELARAAVEARLAACGQVAGPVASTYWWNDELERAEEWFVFLKLPADRYDELAAFLTERHSYDEPEIVATPIVAGSASFLGWISDETRPRPDSGDPAEDPEFPSGEVAEKTAHRQIGAE
jgi:periplasmic divalent cation tolerance protein